MENLSFRHGIRVLSLQYIPQEDARKKYAATVNDLTALPKVRFFASFAPTRAYSRRDFDPQERVRVALNQFIGVFVQQAGKTGYDPVKDLENGLNIINRTIQHRNTELKSNEGIEIACMLAFPKNATSPAGATPYTATCHWSGGKILIMDLLGEGRIIQNGEMTEDNQLNYLGSPEFKLKRRRNIQLESDQTIILSTGELSDLVTPQIVIPTIMDNLKEVEGRPLNACSKIIEEINAGQNIQYVTSLVVIQTLSQKENATKHL